MSVAAAQTGLAVRKPATARLKGRAKRGASSGVVNTRTNEAATASKDAEQNAYGSVIWSASVASEKLEAWSSKRSAASQQPAAAARRRRAGEMETRM